MSERPVASWAEYAQILDAHDYLVLGTADAAGAPWVSPVYFRTDADDDVHWVSSPQARHSRNLAHT